MSGAFRYKPRVMDIRVRPPKPNEAAAEAEDVLRLKPGERPCEWPGCRVAGSAKAPKSREVLHEHYWFCVSHAGEYNRNWDYFAGMSEADVLKAQEARFTGDRPTWEFKASRFSREAASFSARAGSGRGYADPLGALAELDLPDTAEAASVRAKYLELVKRCHPDTNGGDRSTEAKLQRVLKAYKILKSAGLTH
eukprot:gene15154-15297_t